MSIFCNPKGKIHNGEGRFQSPLDRRGFPTPPKAAGLECPAYRYGRLKPPLPDDIFLTQQNVTPADKNIKVGYMPPIKEISHIFEIRRIFDDFDQKLERMHVRPHYAQHLRAVYDDLGHQLRTQSTPSPAKFEELIARIQADLADDGAALKELLGVAGQAWGNFLTRFQQVKGGDQIDRRVMPSAPQLIYRVPDPDAHTVAFFLPAPPDPIESDEITFRHQEVDEVRHQLEKEGAPVMIVGGHMTQDVKTFFLPNLLSSLETTGTTYWHLQYHEDLGSEVAQRFRYGEIPKYIVLEWKEELLNDATLIDALKYAFLNLPSDSPHHLVIVNTSEIAPVEVSAENIYPFAKQVLPENISAVPVVTLRPKRLNVEQAMRFLDTLEAETTLPPKTNVVSPNPAQIPPASTGIGNIIANHIPLITPFLRALKEFLETRTHFENLESAIQRAVNSIWGDVPRDSRALIIDTAKNSVAAGLNAHAFQMVSKEGRLTQHEKGYAVFTITHDDIGVGNSGVASPATPQTPQSGTPAQSPQAAKPESKEVFLFEELGDKRQTGNTVPLTQKALSHPTHPYQVIQLSNGGSVLLRGGFIVNGTRSPLTPVR